MAYDDTHSWVESYVDGCNPVVSDEAYGGTAVCIYRTASSTGITM